MGLRDFFGGKPDRDGFAKLFIRAARDAGLDGNVAYDPTGFAIHSESRTMSLANAHADYCKAPRNLRDKVLRQYVAVVLEPVLEKARK